MPAFQTQYDIGNRALQILGVPDKLTTTFTGSKAAMEIGACYDQLRENELSKNLWKFATRHAMLRAITTNTETWAPDAYASGTTYAVGAVVSSGNQLWQSKVASNLGNTPDVGAFWRRYFGPLNVDPHDSAIAYFVGELASGGGTVYLSLANGNADTPPSSNWLDVGGTTTALQILYPLNAGPTTSSATRNVFPLPYGYLTRAPTNPKGGIGFMGVTFGQQHEDFVLEDNFLLSMQAGPILIRFVSDFVDVPQMSSLFCEGLAARIAQTVCEPITQSTEKKAEARRAYQEAMMAARQNNAIEIGPIDMEIDSLITCRY